MEFNEDERGRHEDRRCTASATRGLGTVLIERDYKLNVHTVSNSMTGC